MDITSLKAAALDHAGDAIIVIDHEGAIQVWNGFAERLFGWRAEQVLGENVSIIIPERLRAAHDRGFFAAMERGALASDGRARNTKALSPAGDAVYVTMTFAMVHDDAGTCIGSVAVAREWVREPRTQDSKEGQAR